MNSLISLHSRLEREQIRMSFYSECLDKGRDYTEGYLEGRRGRIIFNFFSEKYSGAKRALEYHMLKDAGVTVVDDN